MKQKILFLILVLVFSFSCSKNNQLMMATTTSTDNTGLLDYLKPHIKEDISIDLKWVAVGTGKALKMGENCDVDILLVHAPKSEEKFIDEGHGIKRIEVMFNDFILIGPKEDSGKLKGIDVKKAFQKMAKEKIKFISRGDNSGTNKKEINIWKDANNIVPEKESWYVQSGQGMLNTINIASEKKAYTLTDRGTYIKYESSKNNNPDLVIISEGHELLKNQYSLLKINHEKCKKIKVNYADKLVDWFVSQKAQNLIRDFKLSNKQLFKPNAK